MSLVSQTPARAGRAFAWRFGLVMAALALIIPVAMAPVAAYMPALLADARLHAPNLALFAALSPVIKIHLLTALAALVLGAVLMVVRKGRLFHRVAGWVWVCLVAVTAGVTIFITDLNHGAWSWLHLFTAWTLIILPLAVFWAKRRDIARHRRQMMGLFYGGFAINLAFAFIPGRTLWMMVLG
jgi:uncharacterized membrane protein